MGQRLKPPGNDRDIPEDFRGDFDLSLLAICTATGQAVMQATSTNSTEVDHDKRLLETIREIRVLELNAILTNPAALPNNRGEAPRYIGPVLRVQVQVVGTIRGISKDGVEKIIAILDLARLAPFAINRSNMLSALNYRPVTFRITEI
jgi:hypothetical protein